MDKSTKNNNSRDITIGCGSDLQSSSQSQTSSSSSSPSSTTTTTSGKSQTPSIAPQSSQSTAAVPISLTSSGIAGGGGGGVVGALVSNSSLSSSINLHVTTTTGGYHVVNVDSNFSVENLKKVVAKKLKVAKDRICLLHRERELVEGNLKENGLVDGSKIILIPNVETGLLAQRPENTVMQALESLNDSQVNDFLSGKTPLNLSMRLGDHMMLIQLQLSTVHPPSPSHHGSTRSRSSQRCSRSSSSSTIVVNSGNNSSSSSSSSNNTSNISSNNSILNSTTNNTVSSNSCMSMSCTSNNGHHHHYHHHHHHHHHRHHPQHQTSHYHCCNNNGSNVNGSNNGNATINGSSNNISAANCHSSPIKIVSNEKQQSTAMITEKKSSEIVVNNDNKMEIEEINIKESKKISNTLSSTSFSDDSGILDDQSPIKSLSNLVSSPMKTTPINNIPISNNPLGNVNSITKTVSEMNSSSTVTNLSHGSTDTVDGGNNGHASGEIANCNNSDPISAKLTSCLCKRLVNNAKNCGEANLCQATNNHSAASTETKSSGCCNPCVKMFPPLPPLLHKTQSNPIGRRSYRQALSYGNILRKMQNVTCKRANGGITGNGEGSGQVASSSPSTSTSSPSSPSATASSSATLQSISSSSSPSSSFEWSSESSMECDDETNPPTDSRALAEASRNLTQTLRKLSKEVFTNKVDFSDDTPRRTSTGAVIESMKSHGKGIYSGTFSGTLNPALQDRYGRPKRDISTVIHILNDLLSATPQYNRGAKISFEPSNSKSIKHTSSKYNNTTTLVQESCEKCSSGGINCKTNTCAYGECNGHYNANMSGTSPSIGNSSNICHQLKQQSASDLVGGTAIKSVVNCTCRSSSVGTTSNTAETVAIRTESGMTSLSSSIITSKTKVSSLEENNLPIGNNILMGTNSSSGDNRNSCTCSFRGGLSADSTINGINSILSYESSNKSTANAGNICSKCSAEIENNKTKCKLDQLRLVMQQRKQKREARKSKVAPYEAIVLSNNLSTTATLANATASSANSSSSASSTATSSIAPLTSASEVSPNHLVEEVDTAA